MLMRTDPARWREAEKALSEGCASVFARAGLEHARGLDCSEEVRAVFGRQ